MSPADPDISFFRLPRTIDRKSIEQFAASLRAEVLPRWTFACRITTDVELQRLNRTFRRKDCPTDVLSFPADPNTGEPHLGDIAISWQTARQQARDLGHSVDNEIQVL